VDEELELIQSFCDVPGPSGFEGKVRRLFEERIRPYADRFLSDNLGSLIAVKEGEPGGPKILIAGHMDEIGFLVTRITDEGFIKFQTIGGWWEQVMLAQRVVIDTAQGPVHGVIGSKPPHILGPEERKKVYDKKDMFIDVGAKDKAEAESFGIRPGDPIVPWSPFQPLANPDYLMGKAWDDRYGPVAIVRLFQALQGVAHPNVVFGAATVQEEVGLRGATTTANLVSADIGIALDVGIAGDTPGLGPDDAQSKLGQGPSLLIYDGSMIPHRGLRDLVIDTARAEGIPLQFDRIAGGGTDAGAIHRQGAGVPSVVIGVPTRYIHSHAAVFHRRDLKEAVRLLVALVKRLDRATVDALKAGT
jgi:putative aminopeptidase FrvX